MEAVAAIARTHPAPPPPLPPLPKTPQPPPPTTAVTIAAVTSTPTPATTEIKTAPTAEHEGAEEVEVYELRTSVRAVEVAELAMSPPTRTLNPRLKVVVHLQDVAAEGGVPVAGVQGEKRESDQWWARARGLMKIWSSHRLDKMDSKYVSE
jgi:hypothetical protein